MSSPLRMPDGLGEVSQLEIQFLPPTSLSYHHLSRPRTQKFAINISSEVLRGRENRGLVILKSIFSIIESS